VQATALQILSNACHGVHGSSLVGQLAASRTDGIPNVLPTLLRLGMTGSLRAQSETGSADASDRTRAPVVALPAAGITVAEVHGKASAYVESVLLPALEGSSSSLTDRKTVLLVLGLRQTACGLLSRLAGRFPRSTLQTVPVVLSLIEGIDWHAKALARVLKLGKSKEASQKAAHAFGDKLWGVQSALVKAVALATVS